VCLLMLRNGVWAAPAWNVWQLAPPLNRLAFVQPMAGPDYGHCVVHVGSHGTVTAHYGVFLQRVSFMPRLPGAAVPMRVSSVALHHGPECPVWPGRARGWLGYSVWVRVRAHSAVSAGTQKHTSLLCTLLVLRFTPLSAVQAHGPGATSAA
jgi:hypothetical protein